MTPSQFVAKWSLNTRTERAASQEHFLDLCALLGHATPNSDPSGENMAFEKGVDTNRKGKAGQGWADVWKKNHFGWEYKGKHKNLDDALDQLKRYAGALENPKLLVVSDIERIVVHTNFNGTPSEKRTIMLDEIAGVNGLEVLRRVFFEPEALRPGETTTDITRRAAAEFARLADKMRARSLDEAGALFYEPLPVARFLDRVVFCLFAEDIGLLPLKLFTQIVDANLYQPERLARRISKLFDVMATGGDFDEHVIRRFNGSLFGQEPALEMKPDEIAVLKSACGFRWDQINPSITGTLFERFLDVTGERAPLGAHYTTQEDIETLIEPVVLAPLRAEWLQVLAAARDLVDSDSTGEARLKVQGFLEKLGAVRVLDPACGSGNFLYVTLRKLKDLEKEANVFAFDNGLGAFETFVRPEQMLGIEKNPYAIDLAQTTLWIGFFQWIRANGYQFPPDPLLHSTANFSRMDAVLDESNPDNPSEPEWPQADYIIGNPPFLGDKKMRKDLGSGYVDKIHAVYQGRVPGSSNFCCYWFEKSRAMIEAGACKNAGLISTTSIKQVGSRRVLERINESGAITFAIQNQSWRDEKGAAVRISLIGFGPKGQPGALLDGKVVASINSDLTAGLDTTTKLRLAENLDLGFMGVTKVGKFDINEATALGLLLRPNINGRPGSDVVRPFLNGRELTHRVPQRWIVDFGTEAPEDEAALYDSPFKYLVDHVKEKRQKNNDAGPAKRWWLHARARPEFRKAVAPRTRYIGTPTVSDTRVFIWLDAVVLPDAKVIAFPFDDDYTLGVLHSRIHYVWTVATSGRHGKGDSITYNLSECFETFPFPRPDEAQTAAIAEAAKTLDRLRENWLNPPQWTREEVLEFPGTTSGPWARFVHEADSDGLGTVRYPRRVPKSDKMPVPFTTRDAAGQEVTSMRPLAREMAARTLTNLYNERPQWLANAHRALDEAVAVAYNWSADLSDEEILENLLALNQARASL